VWVEARMGRPLITTEILPVGLRLGVTSIARAAPVVATLPAKMDLAKQHRKSAAVLRLSG